MALTIAVGFVVDDAIVMEEVIWQRLEHGEKPFEAALAGAGEISFTVLSISISLIAVFTPLVFMGGVVGLLMREFAVTLSAAVLLSLVLTLTLTPMLCSRFLKRAGAAVERLHEVPGARLHVDRNELRADARCRPAPQIRDADGLPRDDCPRRNPLRDVTYGLLPAAGQRLPAGHDARLAGCLLHKDRTEDPAGRRSDPAGSGRLRIRNVPRLFEPQSGKSVHCAQAQGRAAEPGAPTRSSTIYALSSRSWSACGRSSRPGRTSILAAASDRRNTSTRCRIPISTNSTPGRRRCWPNWRRCRNSGT